MSGLLAPPRAPLGSARELRARLPPRRSRPILVASYAALFGESGLLGPPARRHLRRLVGRSLPALTAALLAALLLSRAFAGARGGAYLAAALALLAAAFALAARRGATLARPADRPSAREGFEQGALALLAAFASAQAWEAHGPSGSSLAPLVDLTLAALVALLQRAVGAALLALALALEGALFLRAGAPPAALPGLALRAGFTVLFALLFYGVLGARLRAARRAEAAAVGRRMRELDERARQLRLLAAAGDAGEGEERSERAARLAEAAVLETDTAAESLLEVARGALEASAAAAYLLGADDSELRLWAGRPGGALLARRLPAGEGALGGVVKRQAPLRLHGEVKAANHYEDGRRPRALLAVPLRARVGGHLRGVVLADRLVDRPFTEREELVLVGLAGELARAAAAERLIRDGRARRDEQERFYQAMERLNRTTTPREVFDAVIGAARDMAPVDFGAVTLVEPGREKPQHRVARAALFAAEPGPGGPGEKGRALLHLAGLEGKLFADNGGLVACAVRLGSALPGRSLRLAEAVVFDEGTRLRGLASLKVLPLRAGDEVLGTLVLGARSAEAYRGDVARQLEVVALQAGDSILRARLFEATERLATTDGLTGLVNHRTLQARLDEHLRAAERYGKKVSFLLLDIDHFKAVNDTYGHPTGDLVLKGIARLLQTEARTTDVAARYGGEELALVMPETDRAGAVRTAERIREKVEQAVFQSEQGELRVTLSIGVSTFPEDGRKKGELIALADEGLYLAKRHGRNRTVAKALLRARPGGP
ncbi:MAG TPA: sensor domain-containing diguanylate cyclase [Anaeromyxobacteraceae bacterium]|nr:sensor domain-containing diguanylate cyclase [Anaeromyxobacteraceae bacterium]